MMTGNEEVKENSDDSTSEPLIEQQPLPSIVLKNCLVNDGGVVKKFAIECFTEDFDLHIEQGKMTQERKVELLEKIQKIVDNETVAYTGVECDIRVNRDSQTGDVVVDMLAHFMKTDEGDAEAMNMSYAACLSVIKNATPATTERACQLMQRIIQSSLIGMDMPGGEKERADIQRALDEQGRKQILEFMPQQ